MKTNIIILVIAIIIVYLFISFGMMIDRDLHPPKEKVDKEIRKLENRYGKVADCFWLYPPDGGYYVTFQDTVLEVKRYVYSQIRVRRELIDKLQKER